jgi:hypothetical protein
LGKIVALVASVLLILYPATRDIAFTALSESYYQVSIFVAATLIGLIMFERAQKREMREILRRHARWQVPIAAIFGAIPGCGGAIFVVTQYIRGAMSFGGVVATLTATMGDAAFLLLAKTPLVAIKIFAICFVMGLVFGFIVDRIHGRDFLRPDTKNVDVDSDIEENPLLSPFYLLWMVLFVPGAIIGISYAFQVDVAKVSQIGGVDWVSPFGAAAALFAIVMWTLNPLSDIRLCISERRTMTRRVTDTTNFITFWVLCGFFGYGVLESYFHLNLAGLLQSWVWLTPLVAVIIGFIPGCGPQVVVATLFVNGVIPLSAQLANAISNDGDALFPAVAIAPKASVIATLYTAIPALIAGYGWMFLFER